MLLKVMRYIITLLLAAIPVFALAQQNLDWRQQAQEMLDEGQTSAALYLLEETGNHINEIQDPIQQVGTLRYLGELYYQAEKPDLAEEWFTRAMQKSLEMTPVWKKFSAVISVLELHRKTVEKPDESMPLLAMPQEQRLLTEVSKNAQAKEIGRYIQCFDKAITRAGVMQMLQEIRGIKPLWVRKRALLALGKITSAKGGESIEEAPAPHFEADAQEKFLWWIALAKHTDPATSPAQYHENLAQAQLLVDQLPTEKRRGAKKKIRALVSPSPAR